jgi:hypothetical protein
MTLVYILLVILPILAELSPKIPTEGVIKKLWLLMVSVGALVALSGSGADLICYGVLLYLIQTLYYNLKFHHRRKHTSHYGKA